MYSEVSATMNDSGGGDFGPAGMDIDATIGLTEKPAI